MRARQAEALQDARLDKGSRLHIHNDVGHDRHVLVNIRQFSGIRLRRLDELVDRYMLDGPSPGYQAAIRARLSIVFAGAGRPPGPPSPTPAQPPSSRRLPRCVLAPAAPCEVEDARCSRTMKRIAKPRVAEVEHFRAADVGCLAGFRANASTGGLMKVVVLRLGALAGADGDEAMW